MPVSQICRLSLPAPIRSRSTQSSSLEKGLERLEEVVPTSKRTWVISPPCWSGCSRTESRLISVTQESFRPAWLSPLESFQP